MKELVQLLEATLSKYSEVQGLEGEVWLTRGSDSGNNFTVLSLEDSPEIYDVVVSVRTQPSINWVIDESAGLDTEVEAIGHILGAIEEVPLEARRRVLQYVMDRVDYMLFVEGSS